VHREDQWGKGRHGRELLEHGERIKIPTEQDGKVFFGGRVKTRGTGVVEHALKHK